MTVAQLLFTSAVYGNTLRVLGFDGRAWLAGEDLAKILEYRTSDGVRIAFSRHKDALTAHSVLAKIDSQGHEIRLFDVVAVRYFCECSKRPGAVALWRWLNDGGMREGSSSTTEPLVEINNVVALKALNSLPPFGSVERKKAYCCDLLKTLLRYSKELEVEDMTHIVEAEVAGLLERRHCPGLNDARYELYRRYWLQGGAV